MQTLDLGCIGGLTISALSTFADDRSALPLELTAPSRYQTAVIVRFGDACSLKSLWFTKAAMSD